MPHRAIASLASLLFASLVAAACGDAPAPAPTPSPSPAELAKEGAPGARAVVDAYLAAARVPDEAAMLALGTPEWRDRERTWEKGFTRGIASKTWALKSANVRDPEVEGDRATVSVGAVFVVGGKDDRKGLRFTLERRDGRWWITDLR